MKRLPPWWSSLCYLWDAASARSESLLFPGTGCWRGGRERRWGRTKGKLTSVVRMKPVWPKHGDASCTGQDLGALAVPPGNCRCLKCCTNDYLSKDCFTKEKCNHSPNPDGVWPWLNKETQYFVNKCPTEEGSCMHWCHPTPFSIQRCWRSCWCSKDIFYLFLS